MTEKVKDIKEEKRFVATKEQIEEWKEKYHNIWQVSLDGYSCILRKPNRKDLSFSMSVIKQGAIKYNEVLTNSIWLGGDEIMRNDDDYFLPLCEQLEEISKCKSAELKKL